MNITEKKKHADKKEMLAKFYTGNVTTKEIVGTGYKYPRGVAGGYLLKELYNIENPKSKVDGIEVKSDGHPFLTEALAKRSSAYKKLVTGNYTLSSGTAVTEFGVIPAPGDIEGFVVFVNWT